MADRASPARYLQPDLFLCVPCVFYWRVDMNCHKIVIKADKTLVGQQVRRFNVLMTKSLLLSWVKIQKTEIYFTLA